MIKIYTDVSMIMIGTSFTGIPRVVMELVKRLDKRSELDLVFIEYDANKDAFRILDRNLFVSFCTTKTDKRNDIRTEEFLSFDDFEKGSIFFDCDTVWKTRVKRSFLYPLLKKNGVKIVPFIQDIIGIDYPQFCDKSDVLNFIDFIGASFLYADRILVTSQTTKNALLAHEKNMEVSLPDIGIVPLGGDFLKKNEDASNVSEKIKEAVSAGEYILMVGTVEPRKNHKLLLDCFQKHLRDRINVVIAGYSGQGMNEFFKKLYADPDYGKKIWHIDNANDSEIDYLYKNCFAMVFPSYIEGYGLPIIESFIREVPVIAADNEINREIGGERALYFEQDNSTMIANMLFSLKDSRREYKELKERIKGFVPKTWDETSECVLKELTEVNGKAAL